MGKKTLFLLLLYFILAPFYLFKSGIPQIADFILLLILILFSFWGDFKKDAIFKTSIIIIIIIFMVNGIWSIILSDIQMNLNSIYYLFNIGILIVVINLYRLVGNKLFKVLAFSTIFSLVIQLITLIGLGRIAGARQILMFNNPNQLGYYALIQLSLVILLFYIGKLRFSIFILGTMISIYLILISLSSAAILSSLFMVSTVFLHLFFSKKRSKKYPLILIGILMLLASSQFLGITKNSTIIESVEQRFESKQYDTESNFSERRYDRIAKHKEYWVFGAGEGGVTRFSEGGEIHANIPAFFFYYGVVGLIFLLILFIKLIDRPTFLTIIILLSIHFYGITHQGLRNPMFWILIGFIYLINKNNLIELESKKDEGRGTS